MNNTTPTPPRRTDQRGGRYLKKKPRKRILGWIAGILGALLLLYLFLCWIPWRSLAPESPFATLQIYLIRNSRESHSYQFVQYFFPGYILEPFRQEEARARSEQANFNSMRDPATIRLDPPPTQSEPVPQTSATDATDAPQSGTEPASEASAEPEPTTLDADRAAFYEIFYQLDVDSTEAYLSAHPAALENGYAGLRINEAGLYQNGTSIRTTGGEQVLAIDAVNGVLLLRVTGETYRGVLAIAKDPAQLHLYTSQGMSVGEDEGYGQTAGQIAQAHNGVLAITGSGFYDEEGVGTGGAMAGFCRCDGLDYGEHRPWGDKRLELRENHWLYVTESQSECGDDVTNAMEFQPAMIVDGQRLENYVYTADNPRACVGQTDRGEILMLAIEGRLADSPGCSVAECTSILQRFRCITAMNMDGGTSAMLWYDGQPVIRCSNAYLPDGRTLPNAWVYVRKD